MTVCGPIENGSTSFGTTCNTYNTTLGQTASTTGNIYGVYDMSGGAWEYVMGNMSSASGTSYTYYADSAGTNFTYSADTAKYLTPYAHGTDIYNQTAYNRGKLGDATAEVVAYKNSLRGGWNNNYTSFPTSEPWFIRGGNYGSSLSPTSVYGIFSFSSSEGFDGSSSTRAALSIAN